MTESAREKTLTGARRPGWYIVQVRTGQEDRMCGVIERACAEYEKQHRDARRQVGLRECFNPRFECQEKWKGEWQAIQRTLLPGYVVADVARPVLLAEALRPVGELCRVLASEETYDPLDARERAWLDGYTGKGDRVVPISLGYKEGDRLVVTEGPLRGREAMIVSFDRKNSLAHVEFHAGPMIMKTTVGLAIMPSGKMRQV